jgi:lipopolysaccharide export LptBFGC system permease protein LptF
MILQRYILRELILNFLFAFVVVMTLGLVGMTFQGLSTFEGLGLALMLRLIPIAAGSLAPWALLLSSCAAATLVYGRLAAENEINAMRMSGIHANRMLAPAVLFGLLLTAASYGVNEYAAPAAHYSRRLLVRESILSVLQVPPPGRQRFVLGRFTLSYADYQNGRMERPYLLAFGDKGIQAEYRAVSGTVVVDPEKPPRIVLSRCSYTQYDPMGNKTELSADSDLSIPLDIEDITRAVKRPPDMQQDEILAVAREARDPRQRTVALTAWHTRYARSAAPMALILVAVPIGIFVKRASRMAGLGAALPPLLIYFVLFFLFQGMGEKARISPAIAAWAPDAILALVAAALAAGVYRR